VETYQGIVRIDARGLYCPEPAILTQKALKSNPEAVEVWVDAVSAQENVSRLARLLGFQVTVEETGEGYWRIQLRK
jgi:TusA-related sulfurtransferase